MSDVEDKVNAIMNSVFGQKTEENYSNLDIKNLPGFDSMHYVELISKLEKNFNIKLSFTDILSFKKVSDLYHCISKLTQG